jgi:hypothetical protein
MPHFDFSEGREVPQVLDATRQLVKDLRVWKGAVPFLRKETRLFNGITPTDPIDAAPIRLADAGELFKATYARGRAIILRRAAPKFSEYFILPDWHCLKGTATLTDR